MAICFRSESLPSTRWCGGQFLFGRHLRQGASGSETLQYTVLARFGGPTGKHLGLIQRDGTSFVIRRETWCHR